ncbi:stage III sporulation protein AB [Tumebacillus algifaecis]|uniref:Stage III sporulation protein AB n=1 Tax=Tumebacillus algifaecis TaxID=1214604 RepID=A0A223D2X4_9BACL|nr:stage III sporulation protein SpoIIIAB [Tumebacillus algifaecis]ASS75952.1 stage III sporulation protein AB [Tumebacillus algifaecis]
MIKLFGSLIILLVATSFGFRMASRYAERSKQLRLFINALQLLETEILYTATPLSEACRKIGTRIPGPVGTFFAELGHKLREGQGVTAGEIWRETLTAHKVNLRLKEADRDVLHSFGQTLGISDRQDQIKHIQLALAHLGTEEQGAREEQSKNEKMWRYLGALMGLTLVILLY